MMFKGICTNLVVRLVLVLTLALTFSEASSSDRVEKEPDKATGPSAKLRINDESRQSTTDTGESEVRETLGAFSADGGSPGYIIGRTYKDDQTHLNPGRSVAWRNTPNIHFSFMGKYVGCADLSSCQQWSEYTMFDPTVSPSGAWLPNVRVQAAYAATHTGRMTQLEVDSTGHAVIATEWFNPQDPEQPTNVELFLDSAGAGAYGTFLADTLPNSLSIDPAEYITYPKIEYQEYNGQTIVHVVALEDNGDSDCDFDAVTYWRTVLEPDLTIGIWTTELVTDRVWSNQFDITASYACNVAIAWIEWPGYCDGAGDEGGVIKFNESTDGGATWSPQGECTEITRITSDHVPWVDISALYDSEAYLHLVYNAGPSGSIDPSGVYHWTNRVAGPDGGGVTSLVAIADGYQRMCGRGSLNVGNTAKPMISQCDTNLIITWTQYGRWQDGDTLDCASEEFLNDDGTMLYNADIYMSVSRTLDGSLWDLQRNLTNSHTPDCDGTDEYNCDHDTYGSMARRAMNTADMGSTYWSSVPEAFALRDNIAPGYPDSGWYVDFQYINDLFPEPATYHSNPGPQIWTYSPIKWLRIPCVDPVIEPQIGGYQRDLDLFLLGTVPVVIDSIYLLNMGNDVLPITSITADVHHGKSSWIEISDVPSAIAPQDSGMFSVTLKTDNPNDAGDSLVADIVVHVSRGDYVAFRINQEINPGIDPAVPVFIVPGFADTSTNWLQMRDWLRTEYVRKGKRPLVYAVDGLQKYGFPDEVDFLENARVLADYIDAAINHLETVSSLDIDRIDIIGHSMGGLIARRYVSEDDASWDAKDVRKLIMMATPNKGVGYASVPGASLLFREGNAVKEVRIGSVKRFNKKYRDNSGTDYYALWGHGGNEIDCLGGVLQPFRYWPNDGLVSRNSAWRNEGWFFSSDIKYNDDAGVDLCHLVFNDPRKMKKELWENNVLRILDDNWGSPSRSFDTTAMDTAPQICYTFTDTLVSGDSHFGSFLVEPTARMTVALFSGDEDVSFSVTSPTGVTLAFDSVFDLVDSIRYFSEIGDRAIQVMDNVETGWWDWNVQTSGYISNSVPLTVLVSCENDLIISAGQDTTPKSSGGPCTLQVRITFPGMDGPGVSGLTVWASETWNYETISPDSIRFLDDGASPDAVGDDGIYTATIASLSDTGIVEWDIHAYGNHPIIGDFNRHILLTEYVEPGDYCCGKYTLGITGNTNCSTDGNLTLSDITRLIDRVYISKALLCCEASGNTNADIGCMITLSDITKLIDAVYISKTPPAECMLGCE